MSLYELPTSIDVNGAAYNIRNRGDFRMIIDCFNALQDEELDREYRVLTALIIFYEGMDSIQDVADLEDKLEIFVKKMFWFINCGQESSPGTETDIPLIDWSDDSTIICAAVNKVANQEIRGLPYLHWWTFMGHYMSVGESILATVVGIRDKVHRGKKLEKWERDFKNHNPQYFNRKQNAADKDFEEFLRNGWNVGD